MYPLSDRGNGCEGRNGSREIRESRFGGCIIMQVRGSGNEGQSDRPGIWIAKQRFAHLRGRLLPQSRGLCVISQLVVDRGEQSCLVGPIGVAVILKPLLRLRLPFDRPSLSSARAFCSIAA